MDEAERLWAIQEIRRLKARRVRCMDEKDWPGYAACHTPDAVSYTFGDNDTFADSATGVVQGPVRGAQAIADLLQAYLDGENKRTTVHHIHPAEIRILTPTTAEGIIPLEDWLWWEDGGRTRYMHGFGHYRQTFEKIDGRWLIKTHVLSRIKVENGVAA